MKTEKGEIKMNHLKKIVSVLLLLCLIAGCVASAEPEKAQAMDAGDGTVKVYDLDNEFSNGKFRFCEKIVYQKNYKSDFDYYGLTLKNEYVVNSAGKKVATWKSSEILKGGGTKKETYTVDFTRLPSGTYTLYFTIRANYNGYEGRFSRKVNHSAGTIKYNSCKIVTNTDGSKTLKVTYQVIQLKGYIPKMEIYNSAGKKVCTLTNCAAISTNDNLYNFYWKIKDDGGNIVGYDTFTFKVTCNGKSCNQKLTLKNY